MGWEYMPELYVLAVVLVLLAWREHRRIKRDKREALGDGEIKTAEDIARDIEEGR